MKFKAKWTLPVAVVGAVALSAGSLQAQPNIRPGTDVALGLLETFRAMGRTGSFPTGLNGLSMSTTSCNFGEVNVPWRSPMNEDHPTIAFMAAREEAGAGRFLQISDRSYLKHGFFALSSSQCTPCENPSDGTFLGVGCSDTYGTGNNGDRFYLGPPDEIDPWQGTWESVCSHFDRGQPPVNPPFNCDGIRSSISPEDVVDHRVEVKDVDLNVDGATFYYAAFYSVPGEPSENRINNGGSREFIPSWSGSRWNLNVPSLGVNPLVWGSILEQWEGATVTSGANGKADGTIFVGVKVTGPDGGGIYHYEYAVHNYDNARQVGTFELPLCPGASVTNFFFHDIDDDLSNQWNMSLTGNSIRFSTTNNPIKWNSFFNFAFDSDAAPGDGYSNIQPFLPGAGFSTFQVPCMSPIGASPAQDLGFAKVGGNGMLPHFSACGGLDTGEMADFVLRDARSNDTAYLVYSFTDNSIDIFGGRLVPFPPTVIPLSTDNNGEIMIPLPGGGGPADLFMQFLIVDPGATFGFSFSNALRASWGP